MRKDIFDYDAETLLEFYQERFGKREGTIRYLNIHGSKREDKPCKPGHHHVLVNDLAHAQCERCFGLFSSKGLEEELRKSVFHGKNYKEALADIKRAKKIVRKMIRTGNFKNIAGYCEVRRYRYLTGLGYQYIERKFYDPY